MEAMKIAPRMLPSTLPELQSSGGPGGGGGPPGVTLNTGLTSHWHFDEAGGQRNDSTANAMYLTQVGAVTQAAGKFSFAASFNGISGNYIYRSTAVDMTPLLWPANGRFECNLWVWLNGLATKPIANVATTAGTNRQMSISYSSTNPGFSAFANGLQMDQPGSPATTGIWYNISVGDNGTNSFFYVNNVLIKTDVRGSSVGVTATSEITFGTNDARTTSLSGNIDCCSLWLGRSLTTTERTYLYNAGAGREWPYT